VVIIVSEIQLCLVGFAQWYVRDSTQGIFTVKLQKNASKATSRLIVNVSTLIMKQEHIGFFTEIYFNQS
jgi:hypothetical protein